MRRRLRLAVAAGAATAIAAAGCGSAGESANQAAGCTAPGVTPDEVKIGMIYPDTGGLAPSLRYARSGIDARIGLANANGGIHGRTISYEWADDESDPRVNGEVARLLVEREGVFGILMETGVATGSAAYLDELGVPVAGMAGEAVWGEHRNMFAFSNASATGPSVTTFGQFARAQGGTRAVVVDVPSSEASSEIGEKLSESLASQGIEVAAHVGLGPAAGPAEVSRQVQNTGADVLVGAIAAETFADIYGAARSAGAQLKVALNPVGYTPTLLADYGAAAAGMTVFTSYQPFEAASPALDAYREAVAVHAPELSTPDQEVAMLSYITADLFLRGLQEAGPCPTREAFITALRGVSDYDGAGLIPGTVDLERSFGNFNECWTFVRVNASGTAFEAVGNTNGGTQWCGERLTS